MVEASELKFGMNMLCKLTYYRSAYLIFENSKIGLSFHESTTFWLLSIIVLVTALLPDYTMKVMGVLKLRIKSIFPGDRQTKNFKNLVRSTSIVETS
jgi:hypothetical protein